MAFEDRRLSGKDVAQRAGISESLVTRKRQQGMSDVEIIRHGEERKRRMALREKHAPKPEPVPNPEPAAVVQIEPQAEGQEPTESVESYSEAQARELRAKADLRELELAEKRAELINGAEHHQSVCEMITTAKSRMLLIPDEIGDRLAVETNPVKCREMLREKIWHAMSELSAKSTT